MTITEINNLSAISLLRTYFGKKDGQTLTEFAAECAPVKDDATFVEEVRAEMRKTATA